MDRSTRFPPGTWTPDRDRSRLGFSAGADSGRFERYEIAVEDGVITATVDGARFTTSTIRREDDLLEVDGQVTIGARTLVVTAAGTIQELPGAVVLELEAVVDRRQFGVESAIGPEVAIHVLLTLTAGRDLAGPELVAEVQ